MGDSASMAARRPINLRTPTKAAPSTRSAGQFPHGGPQPPSSTRHSHAAAESPELQAPLDLAIVVVESEIIGKIEQETRYYITSLVILAHLLGPVVRSHWAIENSLHWVMDMVFRDDECRVRTDHAPANFTTIKHMALNLLKRKPGKQSLRGRRKAAGWDDDLLASPLTA
jgi:predicted transposase YbfD/YdcC